jgi:hypothetical protein
MICVLLYFHTEKPERLHPVSSTITAASWKRETVGRFLKSAAGFQKAASCVFDHDDGFMETGDGRSLLTKFVGLS